MLYHPHFKDEVNLEMIIMETQVKIRFLFNVKKHSISQISRELQLSRNTVKKILRQEKTSYPYKRVFQPTPKLGSYKSQLQTWLEEEKTLPKAQRCSCVKLHERLKAQGYKGAYVYKFRLDMTGYPVAVKFTVRSS